MNLLIGSYRVRVACQTHTCTHANFFAFQLFLLLGINVAFQNYKLDATFCCVSRKMRLFGKNVK